MKNLRKLLPQFLLVLVGAVAGKLGVHPVKRGQVQVDLICMMLIDESCGEQDAAGAQERIEQDTTGESGEEWRAGE
eukprot:599191-Hanusia_phi.AAC.10